jgi:CCR4-NOT complex subunit CAF16
VTVDLDVLVRSDLVNFLVEESTVRKATIVCEWLYPSSPNHVPLPPAPTSISQLPDLFAVACSPSHPSQRRADTSDATHIFDGLRAFPTHICHLQLGATPTPLLTWDPADRTTELFNIALEWIRTDRDMRREKERAAGRARGAREEVSARRRVGRTLHAHIVVHDLAAMVRFDVTFDLIADTEQTRDAKTFFEKYDYSH